MTIKLANSVDVAIVGGGLAGGLIALALAERRPDLSVLLLEQDGSFGGNHIWSFFDDDIDAENRWLLEPLICARWAGYDVAFPRYRRALESGYNSIRSDRFDAHIRATLGDRAVSDCPVSAITADSVLLADGRRLPATMVIDARGAGQAVGLHCGWQKFVGQLLNIRGGHGVERPVIMDATVDQVDGYRFVYLLPFDAETLFIEDTYYSDDPALDEQTIRLRIDAYVRARGWVRSLLHEETGCLPVVYGGVFEDVWTAQDGVVRAGMRAGLFHPLTSYSLPLAVDYATRLAGQWINDPASVALNAHQHSSGIWRKNGYYRMLTRMLFRAAEPDQRYHVLQHFYRLPEPLIHRFYAARSTALDKARILAGKPPVPLARAVRSLLWRGS